MNKAHVLIVDDNRESLNYLHEVLSSQVYKITMMDKSDQLLSFLEKDSVDLILLDVHLQEKFKGMELCRQIKENNFFAHIPIILITGYGDIKMAVEAMEMGAFYFMSKPIKPGELLLLVKRGLENSQLLREVVCLKSMLSKGSFSNIIGQCQQMQDVFNKIIQIAPHDTTVLIHGNSGTGKELVAKAIHQNSPRSNYPFITIDCSTITEGLFESTFFGHIKGAFTGAYGNRAGAFVSADKGTLFLDEIGNLSLPLQAKLLRVLQEHEVLPIGSDKVKKIDVRLITATNAHLEEMVQKKQFRQDLYYRLNVMCIDLPDLKSRLEDLPLLVQHFLAKYKKNGHQITEVSKEARQLMMAYDWPGNIRELENVIEYITIVSKNEIVEKQDLPGALLETDKKKDNETPLSFLPLLQVEKDYIEKILEHTGHNQTKAAKILGIDRKTLWRKIKKFHN